jgi:hypothetical protein
MNVAVLKALFADRANYAIVEAPRREPARVEAAVRPALAFAPETH